MKLTLKRVVFRNTYTEGELYIDNDYFCDTIEDKNRDDNRNGVFDGAEKKVYGETCIPFGTYKIDLNTVSPKFKDRSWAKCCNGKLPRLLNVPHFEGVLIHVGNSPKDSLGCILVGKRNAPGTVMDSTNTFKQLMSKLKDQENVTIEII